jgi:hypothetical protein
MLVTSTGTSCRDFCRDLAIVELLFPKSGELKPIFFHQYILCMCRSHMLRIFKKLQKFTQNKKKKKTLPLIELSGLECQRN